MADVPKPDAHGTPEKQLAAFIAKFEPRRQRLIRAARRALGEGRRVRDTITGWLSGTFAIYRSAGTSYLDPGTVLESSCYRKVGVHDQLHSFRLDRN